jgi:hypothetical protein
MQFLIRRLSYFRVLKYVKSELANSMEQRPGARRFVTVFAKARQWSLSCAERMQYQNRWLVELMVPDNKF